ncbi:protein Hook homolog 3 [Microplitis mediator]|uniref:protein Hook homolog 3 n=1 Tax=Microplitis mediator TaxID=375433 RepID=UPI0025521294|nr:protein Hook homolog 3 [Microplitis mediator]
MNDYQLESLIKWLNTFDLIAEHSSPEELSDGVAISEALNQIAPDWFSTSWKSKIKTNIGTNWRLRVSNLKKIVEAIMEYYSEFLSQPLSGYIKPNASKIGEQCDLKELKKLLQLVLGCAINCTHKQQYITSIMKMEETVQQAIMQNIQELEDSIHGSRLSLGASLNFESIDIGNGSHQKLLDDLQTNIDLKDQLGQRCHELDLQLSLLQEEKALLISENKKLQKYLEELENSEHSVPSLKYSGLRKQIDSLKEEIFKIETSRDDYRLRTELLEKEIFELQSKQEELHKLADEANTLKDEIDALRETADKVAKYELTIESYKKKMEDMSDMRRQVRILEDKNFEYAKLKEEHEEEIKKSLVTRNHLELCKQQLSECCHKLNEQITKYDELEFKSKKLETELRSMQREKERLIVERDYLKESNEELKCTQLQTIDNVTSTIAHTIPGTDTLPAEMKEKLLRLESENKLLKLEQLGHVEKLPTVQALLDNSEKQLNTVRGQNYVANQRIMELETKLEQLTEYQSENNKADNSILQQKIFQLQNENKLCGIDREQLTLQLEEKETTIQSLKQKIINLQDNILHKEFEISALEERYKKYIEKAKTVIKSIDPKQNNYPCEVLLLRNQIIEKHKIIDNMKQSLNEFKLLNEMEEKLIISAFYHLGFICQRELVDQRLLVFNSNQGNSFLTRQRQFPVRRTINYSIFNSK